MACLRMRKMDGIVRIRWARGSGQGWAEADATVWKLFLEHREPLTAAGGAVPSPGFCVYSPSGCCVHGKRGRETPQEASLEPWEDMQMARPCAGVEEGSGWTGLGICPLSGTEGQMADSV